MKDLSIYIKTAEYIARHCVTICGAYHGSTWLFDKLARLFDKQANKSVEAITIPVFLNAPLMCEGEATIHRDGKVEIRRKATKSPQNQF